MDIQLNINSATKVNLIMMHLIFIIIIVPINFYLQATQRTPNTKNTRTKSSNDEKFQLTFVKPATMTAKVARKRPVKSTTSTHTFTFNSPGAGAKSHIDGNKTKQQQKKFGGQSEEDVLLNIASCHTEPEISLSLNVINDASAVVKVKKPARISRTERRNKAVQRGIQLVKRSLNDTTGKVNTEVIRKPPTVVKNAIVTETVAAPAVNAFRKVKVPEAATEPPGNAFKHRINTTARREPIVPDFTVAPTAALFTGSAMNSINLHPHLVKSVEDLMSINELTAVQKRAIPIALAGGDMLIRSATGSGKTLAYALPIVHMLQAKQPKISRSDGIYAAIIVPTRELAIQTYEIFVKLLKPFTYIVATYLSGGEKRKSEKSRLRKGINVLIGTPGRLCDHLLHTETFKLDKVQYLVLDEADRLYDMGYENDVKMIIDAINEPRANKPVTQTLLLSATLTPALQKLAGLALKNPQYIDTGNDSGKVSCSSVADITTDLPSESIVIPSTIQQAYVTVPYKMRMITLCGLIATLTEKKNAKILIFLATENLVDYHYDLLTEILTKPILDEEEDQAEHSDLEDEDNLLANEHEKQVQPSDILLPKVKFYK